MDLIRALCDLLFHGCFAFSFIACYLEETSPQMDARYEKHGFTGHKTFAGKFKYATFLNLLVQITYFLLSTVNAFVEIVWLLRLKVESLDRIQAHNDLRHMCNFIFTGVAFTAAAFVVSQFWILYAIDRNTVFSLEHEKVIPRYHNHILHTLPLIAVLLDSYFFQHFYQENFLHGVWPTLAYSFGCVVWNLIVRYFDTWSYPFLGELSNIQRLVLFMSLFVYNLFLYRLGEFLSRTFWPSSSSSSSVSTSSKTTDKDLFEHRRKLAYV